MSKYVIEQIQRVSIQYYKIKINNKFYLLDYSNPKNLKNYFINSFSNVEIKWHIYDIENITEDEYMSSKRYNLGSKLYKWISCFIIFILLNSILFPSSLNLSKLTKDTIIMDNWILIVLLVLLGSLLLIILLISLNKPKVKLSSKEQQIILQVADKKRNQTAIIVFSAVFYILLLLSTISLGIIVSSYVSIIAFTFLGSYLLIFNKFFQCTLKGKYQIIDKER